jgi:hypothetical protein
MNIPQPLLPSTLFPQGPVVARPPGAEPAASPAKAPAAAPARAFSAVLDEARATPARQVRRGDTLLGIVREQAGRLGVSVSDGQSVRLAQQLARDSGIADPNRIFPGQKLALEGVQSRLAAVAAGAAAAQTFAPAAQVLARTAAAPGPVEVRSAPAQRQAAVAYAAPAPAQAAAGARPAGEGEGAGSAASAVASAHPVLQQTLDRAVARGFIPAIERGDVYDKILELSARHRFKPDDFARLTLIESDGMNPRASNERCHGIIQFCDGNDRGAATAGFGANPRAILGFSVYQQLHLVDRYFSEVGVRSTGAGGASLDELYLAVLMPAARNTTDPQAPLGIPGPQASVLHPGGDRSAPITRQSILDGLQQYATQRLASFAPRAR